MPLFERTPGVTCKAVMKAKRGSFINLIMLNISDFFEQYLVWNIILHVALLAWMPSVLIINVKKLKESNEH